MAMKRCSIPARHGAAIAYAGSASEAAAMMRELTNPGEPAPVVAAAPDKKPAAVQMVACELEAEMRELQLQVAKAAPSLAIKTMSRAVGALRVSKLLEAKEVTQLQRFSTAASVLRHYDGYDLKPVLSKVTLVLPHLQDALEDRAAPSTATTAAAAL